MNTLRSLSLCLVLVAIALPAAAQTAAEPAAGPAEFQLTITGIPQGAALFINGEQRAFSASGRFAIFLPVGTHEVLIMQEGFEDFVRVVALDKDTQIAVNLDRDTFRLTITGIEAGSVLWVGGDPQTYSGGRFTGDFPPGTYEIRVNKPGFEPFETTVQLTSDRTVTVRQVEEGYRLTINGIQSGSTLFVNGDRVTFSGSTFQGTFAPGNVRIRLTRSGFQDYEATINLNEDKAVTVRQVEEVVEDPNSLRVGAVQTGQLTGSETFFEGKRAFVYTLNLSSSQSFTVNLSSGDFDSYLFVRTPDGRLFRDDDGGSGVDSRISVSNGPAGIYQIYVSSFGGSERGAYRLGISSGVASSTSSSTAVSSSSDFDGAFLGGLLVVGGGAVLGGIIFDAEGEDFGLGMLIGGLLSLLLVPLFFGF